LILDELDEAVAWRWYKVGGIDLAGERVENGWMLSEIVDVKHLLGII
jgi:hypothetical protein